MHEDDFVERPAAYRAMLGSHYYDTGGARLNVLLPTPFFWQVGAEAFAGDQLTEGEEDIGVYTVNTRLGGDISLSQSWQLGGLSWLRNRHAKSAETGGDGSHDHDHEEGHDHSHGAAYTGENLYIADLVWKWSPPDGNNREQQLTLSGEYLYADELNQFAASDDTNEGWYVSGVYQFAPPVVGGRSLR